MFRKLAAALAVAGAIGLAQVPTAVGRTCRSGYTHATINHKQKCLHAGEYCSHKYQAQYLRYHFTCVVVGGVYRLERH